RAMGRTVGNDKRRQIGRSLLSGGNSPPMQEGVCPPSGSQTPTPTPAQHQPGANPAPTQHLPGTYPTPNIDGGHQGTTPSLPATAPPPYMPGRAAGGGPPGRPCTLFPCPPAGA